MKKVFLIIVLFYVVSIPAELVAKNAKPTPPDGMVFIAGGEYLPFYRVNDKTKSQSVSVNGFFLDVHQVTNSDFKKFVSSKMRWRKSQIPKIFTDSGYLQNWSGDLDFDADILNSPVTNVSWFAAKSYCAFLGKRLPTMDEWEFAALASETKSDATKEKDFHKRILNWYGKPNSKKSSAVGSVYKNYYGVHDMHGLVWEWVADFNSVMMTGESRGDKSIEKKLYCAGGAIGTADPNDYAAFMRYAFRASLNARYTVDNLGFRCAKGGVRE